ncbi:MAG: hypothetical protein HWN65_11965 [Candidatus Helarchaeota archaeon]|nr:hypothetical protein [Candidatus Helarchaeota archaeon]
MGPLNGIILSIVDEKGPHPQFWYPNFASFAEIYNSAVKSFSIMIGEKTYREKSPRELTCFGILPFPDVKSIGFIHFFGTEDIRTPKKMEGDLPSTITLLFPESYRDEVCKKSPKLHQFLERESKDLWSSLQNDNSSSDILSEFYHKIEKYFDNL